eukprot:3486577-Pyramimonas_sp.AAC.1
MQGVAIPSSARWARPPLSHATDQRGCEKTRLPSGLRARSLRRIACAIARRDVRQPLLVRRVNQRRRLHGKNNDTCARLELCLGLLEPDLVPRLEMFDERPGEHLARAAVAHARATRGLKERGLLAGPDLHDNFTMSLQQQQQWALNVCDHLANYLPEHRT